MNRKNRPAFAIYTLGCKVNQEESAAIAALMEEKGWQQKPFQEKAQVYIINTCTVTHLADRKSRAMIRRAVKHNPGALVVATGCYAQTSHQELAALRGIDLVVGVDQRIDLPRLIEERLARPAAAPQIEVADISKPHPFVDLPATGTPERARAYLKIEDGCDAFCHYCAVPYARGPVRSLPPEKALAYAKDLIGAGYLEIVLSGIHVGAYGQDLPGGIHLASLLKELLQLPALGRLRLSSIEPLQFTPELLALLEEESAAPKSKLCPHFHIPLQAGSDKTLKAMGRRYTCRQYEELLTQLRGFYPQAAFTSDMMVGYPGESPEDFAESYDFCRRQGFARLHVFPYSPRKGTVAADLPGQIDPQEKEKRSQKLLALGEEMAAQYGRGFIGKTLQLLPEQSVEYEKRSYLQGHGENYLNLLLPANQEYGAGFIPVKGESWKNGSLMVEAAGKSPPNGEI